MEIRQASIKDIESLMEIYDFARNAMQQMGNTNQWINGYPARDVIVNAIENKKQYICLNGADIVGTFYFAIEEDVTYHTIYEGEWLNNESYGVIHRLASNGQVRGIGRFCLDWCFNQCGNIRVDTHHDNLIMQHLFLKNGYQKCGIIFVNNGTARIAFQKNQ